MALPELVVQHPPGCIENLNKKENDFNNRYVNIITIRPVTINMTAGGSFHGNENLHDDSTRNYLVCLVLCTHLRDIIFGMLAPCL